MTKKGGTAEASLPPLQGREAFLYLLREASDLKNRDWEVNKYVYYVMEVAPLGPSGEISL